MKWNSALCFQPSAWLLSCVLRMVTFSSCHSQSPAKVVNHPGTESILLPSTPGPNSLSPPPTNDPVIGFSLKGLCDFSLVLISHRSAPGSVRGEVGILGPGAKLHVDWGLCLPLSQGGSHCPDLEFLGQGTAIGAEKQGSFYPTVARRPRVRCLKGPSLPSWSSVFSSVNWEH